MTDNLTFTARSNATRAAKRMIANSTAPASQYTIRPRDGGRFEILWLTAEPGLAMAAWPAPTADELAAAGIVSTEAVEAELQAGQPEASAIDEALNSDCGDDTAVALRHQLRQPHKSVKGGSGPRAKFAHAPVEHGKLPEKPVLTAAGFTASYQKRIDALDALADAGDWPGVEAYDIKGKNTYSKIVARYRAQLLAARPSC
jgi:hypothetical protein